ncbi:Extracellular solute-binding protein family 5 [Mesotoga infera]|uniref:Extracellular solute-binding protein family 5 n=1 Tax=Mesotoga infera TaxID=1236046 RepID=A0A7Z7LFC4_9BACT|nr:ABC transporter substrate-binding protein [Mesotoga infera]SSC13063.1 Extracellular solute-binding protein family 5 [Mesotoga infera]
MRRILSLLIIFLAALSVFSTERIVVAVMQDPDFLDPHRAAASGTYEMMFNVFEGLLKPDSKGNVIPAIAESYSISPDGLVYTFKLREGVKFHNGKEVTMNDVLYSLNRLKGSGEVRGLSSDFEKFVSKIEAIGDRTVEITLNTLNTDFLDKFINAIIPADNPDHERNPIGTGPFKFVAYQPGQRVVIAKFNEYWNPDLPLVDEVEFRIIPDNQAALMSFMAGEVQMLPRLDAIQADILMDRYNLISAEQNMVQLMAMNLAREPFDDLKVRKAINLAIDKEEIIEIVANGYGTALGSNMSPIMERYYQEGLEDYYKTDVVAAKSLLAQAGYPEGFKTKITVPSNYQFHVDTAQVIVEQLKKVGITAEIELIEWSIWLDRVYTGRDYEMTIVGLTGKLSAYDILKRYLSDYPRNFYNYFNPRYDELVNSAIKQTDIDKKAALFKQAQVLLTEEAVAVYIMDPNFIVALAPNLFGYNVYPLYVQDMSTLYYK